MRLLHFDDSGRLVLKDFRGREIPPYAILSHRWGRGNDEVSFEDVVNNRYDREDVHQNIDYRKIDFCATQAALDQLEYFWIDTCCFDKWNRAERSYAVESMFRWYAKAAKCYVFLSDVSVHDPTNIDRRSIWEKAFRDSDWFNRGWTLQELLAPHSVEFFSKEGHRLGNKESLERMLCEITTVPAEALQGQPLDSFSIDDRVKWAEKRETTEAEDAAYCLFGILDVHMPPSYGEGKIRALKRLTDELHSTAIAPSIIPFSLNHRFVGRELQLAELRSKLFQDLQTTFIAITGAGGTGKSQLALALAYEMKAREQNCAVFWLDASDPDRLREAYRRIAQKLGLPGWNDTNANVSHLVHRSLSRDNAWRWLLVFDNVETTTFDISESSARPYADRSSFFPRHEQGSVVFTTTSANAAVILAKRNIIMLHGLTPDDAQTMLEEHLSKPVSTSETDEAKLLLHELSYLPLAIVQAGALMKLADMSPKEYRSQSAEYDQNSTGDPITTTLLVSLNAIRHAHSQAAEYLSLIACVDRTDIAEDFLAPPTPERKTTIRILEDYFLITRRPAESALDVHRLVHKALRNWLQDKQRREDWNLRATKHLLSIFPDHRPGNRSRWRRLIPHAKKVLSTPFDEQGHEEGQELAWRCAMSMYSDGSWKEAEELFKQIVETAKRVLGEEHSDTLTSIGSLAETYRNQGRWNEAEELEVQVMETTNQVFGGEHPNTLRSIASLASTYWKQGRLEEAEELELQVMQTLKRVLGEDHPDTLATIANLAVTYRDQGRWEEAEELEVQVMETTKQVLGESHPDTLTSMANLALTYWKQGQFKEAEVLFKQVLETTKGVLGEEHPDTLSSICNLASTYRKQGQLKNAVDLEVQVTERMKRVLGEKHPDTLTSMANLAFTWRDLGRHRSAIELISLCASLSRDSLGAEHPDTMARDQWSRDWKNEERQRLWEGFDIEGSNAM